MAIPFDISAGVMSDEKEQFSKRYTQSVCWGPYNRGFFPSIATVKVQVGILFERRRRGSFLSHISLVTSMVTFFVTAEMQWNTWNVSEGQQLILTYNAGIWQTTCLLVLWSLDSEDKATSMTSSWLPSHPYLLQVSKVAVNETNSLAGLPSRYFCTVGYEPYGYWMVIGILVRTRAFAVGLHVC